MDGYDRNFTFSCLNYLSYEKYTTIFCIKYSGGHGAQWVDSRVGDLNVNDLGATPWHSLSSVIPGANSPRFVNSPPDFFLPVGFLTSERGGFT